MPLKWQPLDYIISHRSLHLCQSWFISAHRRLPLVYGGTIVLATRQPFNYMMPLSSTSRPFHQHFFNHNLCSMAFLLISHPDYRKMIATNFCACHDSCAVMACAKFWCNLINKNWISAKCFVSLDLNCEQKLLVKWVDGLVLIHGNCSGGGLLLVSWTHSCSIGLTHWCPETVIFIIKCYSQM